MAIDDAQKIDCSEIETLHDALKDFSTKFNFNLIVSRRQFVKHFLLIEIEFSSGLETLKEINNAWTRAITLLFC